MTRRATEVTRIDLRGDESTATKYIPYGRVLLARAIAKLNSDGRKVGVEKASLENRTVHIIAQADFAGNSITITAGPRTDCCTYSDDLPLCGEDEGDEEGGDFGGTWEGYECGDVMTQDGYYNSGSQAPVNLQTEDKAPVICYNPCPKNFPYPTEGMSGISLAYCFVVRREWQLDEDYEYGGGSGDMLLGVCPDGLPIILSWNVDVTKKHKYYDWGQYQWVYDGMAFGGTYSKIGENDCTLTYYGPSRYPGYQMRRWWEIEKWDDWRECQLTITLTAGGHSQLLVDIRVSESDWFEEVSTFYKGQTAQEFGNPFDGTQCTACPPFGSTPWIPGVSPTALEDSAKLHKKTRGYNPVKTGIITRCPDDPDDTSGEEEEGETVVCKEISPDGTCARCVVYVDGEVSCYGPWISLETGGRCPNPPADSTSSDSSDEDSTEGEEELPAIQDTTPEGGEDVSEFDPEDSIVDSDADDFAPPSSGTVFDPSHNEDATSTADKELYNRKMKDLDESVWLGPDRGVYSEWAEQLLSLPVSAFETWVPPNLISIATGGKKCKSS